MHTHLHLNWTQVAGLGHSQRSKLVAQFGNGLDDGTLPAPRGSMYDHAQAALNRVHCMDHARHLLIALEQVTFDYGGCQECSHVPCLSPGFVFLRVDGKLER